MKLLEHVYRLTHRNAIKQGAQVPYYWKYSISTVIAKPIRKFFSAVIIPTIPFSNIRIWCYRRCGYKIGMRASIIARQDVVIGKDAVVGACTLVNKSVPADTVAVGVPARFISDNKRQDIRP